jgi:hypothetical protein
LCENSKKLNPTECVEEWNQKGDENEVGESSRKHKLKRERSVCFETSVAEDRAANNALEQEGEGNEGTDSGRKLQQENDQSRNDET